MNFNHQQYLSCLHPGQNINIQRSNGHVHHAIILQVNRLAKTVTVEWQEKNEGKGKEVDLDAIVKLNPQLFTSINGAESQVNGNTITQTNRRSKQDQLDHRRQSHPVQQQQTNNNDFSPQRQPGDSNKSKVVKEIQRIAANREQRRVKHEETSSKIIRNRSISFDMGISSDGI